MGEEIRHGGGNGLCVESLGRARALLRHGGAEIDNSTAEHAISAVTQGRKDSLFAGSNASGERAAAMDMLIGTAKLDEVDSEAYLRHVSDRIADHPIHRITELLPWIVSPPAQDPTTPPSDKPIWNVSISAECGHLISGMWTPCRAGRAGTELISRTWARWSSPNTNAKWDPLMAGRASWPESCLVVYRRCPTAVWNGLRIQIPPQTKVLRDHFNPRNNSVVSRSCLPSKYLSSAAMNGSFLVAARANSVIEE